MRHHIILQLVLTEFVFSGSFLHELETTYKYYLFFTANMLLSFFKDKEIPRNNKIRGFFQYNIKLNKVQRYKNVVLEATLHTIVYYNRSR